MELDGTMKQAVVGWDLSRVVFRDLERDYPVVERGEGIYLYDTKGRKYIDGSGGSSVVTSIGHGNKRVAVVAAEAVMRPLPEIGFFIGGNSQPGPELAAGVFVEPVEVVWFFSLQEFLFELHRISPV